MKLRVYAAELVGTFVLALVVRTAIISGAGMMTPLFAGLALGLSVYAIGGISGAHCNPAITLALFSVRKIKPVPTLCYIVAQCIGGLLALLVSQAFTGVSDLMLTVDMGLAVGLSEALGAALLAWAVSSVVFGKTPEDASGITIGTGLALGIVIATGSNGILNPAVALALGSVNVMYVAGPVVGAVLAAWGYRAVAGK